MKNFITLKNYNIAFRLESKINFNALKDINVTIKSGDFVALIGNNGSGKSTLLRCLAEIYKPDNGIYQKKGSLNCLIDIMLGIEPDLNGIENIYNRAMLMGFSKKHIDINLENIINFSELGNFIYEPLRTYSVGMLARLFFSITTSFKHDILILDEWLSVGDNNFQRKCNDRLNSLVSDSNIVVMATHSKELAMNVCNRFICLDNGRIVLDTRDFNDTARFFNYSHLLNI